MNEPLVLLPDMMCDARLFQSQITVFSRERAVHIGSLSNGATIETIAENTLTNAPEKFALAGHGMGAIVAMEIIRRAPTRVTRIALMSTSAQSEMPMVAAAREALIVKAKSNRLAEVIEEEIKSHYVAPGSLHDEFVTFLRDMALTQGADNYVVQARALQKRPDQQKTLRMVRCPALILCGAEDELTPVLRHEFISTLVPYSKLETIADAGHYPSLEQPNEVTRLLSEWLAQPLVLR